MITAAGCKTVGTAPIAEIEAVPPLATQVDSRTRELLRGAIVPTLLRLAWPNILVMLAQASTGLIETWWVSHLGTEALAGMALVFPIVMRGQNSFPISRTLQVAVMLSGVFRTRDSFSTDRPAGIVVGLACRRI